MIIELTDANQNLIHNPEFARYLSIYQDIKRDFLAHILETGLELETTDLSSETASLRDRLRVGGAIFRNNDHSIYINQISPACEACREGVGSATFFISLRCHRHCYYCFNPNQEHYEKFRKSKRDLANELKQIRQSGMNAHHIALTGGEPLLHKQEAFDFFQLSKQLFPEAHTRLYTAGDFIDKETLEQLAASGLDEIRFSIRTEDSEQDLQANLERIALSKTYLDSVMVEMPVPPGSYPMMTDLLLELDRLGLTSINLLELCFPFHNVQAFQSRGFKIKNPPYDILYDYWYAGGLPIAYSEIECLKLLEFALERELKMGIHYCSLENKHTGQIYQQNHGKSFPERYYFSERDFFLKTAKAFGRDVGPVRTILNREGAPNVYQDTEHEYIEFHPQYIPALRALEIDLALSYNVVEHRAGGQVIREISVDLVRPADFEPDIDL
jgi:pyruvate formate-lyase activating enzyme-like uncharacterized protein